MRSTLVLAATGWVLAFASATLCSCTPADDVVATLAQRQEPPPPKPPPDVPTPSCAPNSFRLVVLRASGEALALEKDSFVPQSKEALTCLMGGPLLAMTTNADGIAFVSSKPGLQQVSSAFSSCGQAYQSQEPLEAIAFVRGPQDSTEQLYAYSMGTFWRVQLEAKVARNTRIGAVRPGLSVKSLSVDGKGRLLAFVEEKDVIRVGPVNLTDGTISLVWSIARPPGEPFAGGVERDGRFELLFGYALYSFDPSQGVLTGLAKLPSDLPLPLSQPVLTRQVCR
jgi:hypothetical protein